MDGKNLKELTKLESKWKLHHFKKEENFQSVCNLYIYQQMLIKRNIPSLWDKEEPMTGQWAGGGG